MRHWTRSSLDQTMVCRLFGITDILLIRAEGTYFNEILFEMEKFSFKKMHQWVRECIKPLLEPMMMQFTDAECGEMKISKGRKFWMFRKFHWVLSHLEWKHKFWENLIRSPMLHIEYKLALLLNINQYWCVSLGINANQEISHYLYVYIYIPWYQCWSSLLKHTYIINSLRPSDAYMCQ